MFRQKFPGEKNKTMLFFGSLKESGVHEKNQKVDESEKSQIKNARNKAYLVYDVRQRKNSCANNRPG